jgi:hypothetical protein
VYPEGWTFPIIPGNHYKLDSDFTHLEDMFIIFSTVLRAYYVSIKLRLNDSSNGQSVIWTTCPMDVPLYPYGSSGTDNPSPAFFL